MRNGLISLIAASVALAAALTAAPAAAQNETSPPPEDEILVVGDRPLDRPFIYENLRKIAVPMRNGRILPRYHEAVCPRVVGIERSVAAVVEARIRANSSALGLSGADEACMPNATLLILEQPREMFELLIEKRPNLLGPYVARDRHVNAIRADLKAGLPVVAWNVTDLRADAGVVDTSGAAIQVRTQSISRWDSTTFRAKAWSVLVFDKKRLVDVEATQLADFATLYLLGSPRNPPDLENLTAPTMLTLFREGPKAAPQRLTDFDRAFLKGSYTMRRNAWSKRLPSAVLKAYENLCRDGEAGCTLKPAR